MLEYIFPVTTDDYRIAFCQATAPLCPDVQRKIWEEVLYCTQPIETPPAPKKCNISYNRLPISLPRDLFKHTPNDCQNIQWLKPWMTVAKRGTSRYLDHQRSSAARTWKYSSRSVKGYYPSRSIKIVVTKRIMISSNWVTVYEMLCIRTLTFSNYSMNLRFSKRSTKKIQSLKWT